MKVTITHSWDAAHRLPGHEGKCRFLHGHRYVAEVEVDGEIDPDSGMVADFGEMKRSIAEWIDREWDHNVLLHIADVDLERLQRSFGRAPFMFSQPPTVEVIARELALTATERLGNGVGRVRVYETPTCWAEWNAPLYLVKASR